MHEKVTAVIPGYNCADLTTRCLNHLSAHAPGVSVIYVDDGSTEAEFSSVRQYLHHSALDYTIIRNAANRGFSHAVNCGLRIVKNNPLVLNNDCYVGPECVAQLHATLERHPEVAAVVPVTDGPNLSKMDRTPERRQRFKQSLAALRSNSTIEEVAALVRAEGHQVSKRMGAALPFFCALLRKEAMDAVGILNAEDYPSGLGADDEWCLRAVAAGWRTAIDFGAFAAHDGWSTFKRFNINRRQLQQEAHHKLNKARRKG